MDILFSNVNNVIRKSDKIKKHLSFDKDWFHKIDLLGDVSMENQCNIAILLSSAMFTTITLSIRFILKANFTAILIMTISI